MKVVVTGATGLLGSHLACLLRQKGLTVFCIEHNSNRDLFRRISSLYGFMDTDFSWCRADILDVDSLIQAFEGKDAVFHCAAVVSYRKKDAQKVIEINVQGTRNCCNACLKSGTPTLIFASSIAALGRKFGENHVNENTEWQDSPANSIYGISKHLGELEVFRAAEEGLSIGIVNPGVIIGPGDGQTSSNTMFKIIAQESPFYPIGKNGFVGIEDVCKAMWMIYDQKRFGQRYLLVSENLYFKEVLTHAAQCMNKKVPTVALGGALLKTAIFIAKFCEYLRIPFPFPSQGLVSTSSISTYTPLNLQQLEGFEFTPIQSVIEKTISELKTTSITH